MTDELFEYPPGVDRDSYDLQTYLEGGTEEAMAAARRLDWRSVAVGRMTPELYVQTWGEQS